MKILIMLLVVALAITFALLRNKPQPVPVDDDAITVHLDFLKSLRLPAIALTTSTNGGKSKIGGLPSLPDAIPWPEWKSKSLSFLCQIDLGEIPENCDRQGLPTTGMLYFFYNQEQETWGFDPKDIGSWRVIYSTKSPEVNDIRAAPSDLSKDFVYAERTISFFPIQTYPDWQDRRVYALELSDIQSDQYIDICYKVFGEAPAHHLFGHPTPIQGNEMDLECQLVSNGIYGGDASGYQNPKTKELESGRVDWILLFQLDTDDDAKMMWGDSGMLYFWIRKQDLEKGQFDKCWMILQCG